MKILIAVLATSLALMASKAVLAQNPYAAARIVNQSIITNYDVSQRVRFLTALGLNAGGIREGALTQLTEDRLKQAAIDEIGLSVSEEEREAIVEEFAAQRQMSAGALRNRMRSAGVDQASFDEFMETLIGWRTLVNLRFRERASPSESDLRNALNAAASRGQESVFLREIAIPFAERGQQGARSLAEQISARVRGGASFASLARQYSRTPTAQRGGSLGWNPVNRLPPALATQLLTLSPGDVTTPIVVPAGVILLQLVDIREDANTTRPDVAASYVRIDLSEGQDAAAMVERIDDCLEAERLAVAQGGESGRFGPDPLTSIAEPIALVLAGLDAEESGVTTAFGTTSVITLCSRQVETDPEQMERLRSQLFNRRMSDYADGYVQELISDAVIVDK